MRILVIDDQRAKYNQLKPILLLLFPNAQPKFSKTFLSGIARLENEPWDLVFLDMSFDVNESPTEDAGFVGLAGLQVVQHIHRLRIPCKVIIFTAHTNFEDPFHKVIEGLPALTQHVEKYFGDLCLGCVSSKSSEREIEMDIRRLISKNFRG